MAYLDRHVPLNDTEEAHKATETLRAVTDPVLEARGLARHYGQVAALQDIDLDLRPGESRRIEVTGLTTDVPASSLKVLPYAGLSEGS